MKLGHILTIMGRGHITGKGMFKRVDCIDFTVALFISHYYYFGATKLKYSVLLFLVLSLANLCSSWIAKMCMCICLHDRLICDMLAAKKGGLRNHVQMANR